MSAHPELVAPTVKVIWGPIVKEVAALSGLTVGSLYRGVREAFGIPSGAKPLVNGARAEGASHSLKAGDTCEFVRHAGEKGA